MSRFMVDHRLAGLDREAAGVEGDALADQHHAGRLAARPWRACSRAGSAAAAWPTPGRRRGCRRSRRPRAGRSSQTSHSRPVSSASDSAWSASQCGFLRLEGTVASIRARQPAPPTRERPAQRRSDASSVVGSRRARPGATGLVLGAGRAPVEAERAEHRADHERLERRRAGRRAGSRWRRWRRSRVARASAAPARRKSAGVWSPTPTSRTSAAAALSGPPSGHRQRVDLAGLARGLVRARARRAGRGPSLGPPARRHPVRAAAPVATSPGEDRQRDDLDPADRVRAAAPLSANSGGETWGGRTSRPDRGARVSRRRP